MVTRLNRCTGFYKISYGDTWRFLKKDISYSLHIQAGGVVDKTSSVHKLLHIDLSNYTPLSVNLMNHIKTFIQHSNIYGKTKFAGSSRIIL